MFKNPFFLIFEEKQYKQLKTLKINAGLWGTFRLEGAVALEVCQSPIYKGFYIYILYIFRQQSFFPSFSDGRAILILKFFMTTFWISYSTDQENIA